MSMIEKIVVVAGILNCSWLFAVDAIDRLTAERLEAAHQDIAKFKAERRDLPRVGALREYRANLHVHSAFSHDSRGKIEDIVAAAKKAGSQILMFTEHPADHYDVFEDGHQGVRDGVLLIPGAETNGMLVYPRQRIKEFGSLKPQELSEIVRGREGLTFLSHLEERMDWQIKGLTGVEIYNTHADVKDEKRLAASMRNPLWLVNVAELVQRYPQEAYSSLLDYPADYLKRWDELCLIAPHTGVSANDAHQNTGLSVVLAEDDKVRVNDGLGEKLLLLDKAVFTAIKPIPVETKVGTTLFQLLLDRYENSLRHVGTHLLMTELSQPAVWQALSEGRAFVAFDWIADATGFDFAAEVGKIRHEMGSHVELVEGTKLVGQAPLPAHWRLIRDGKQISESDGDRFEFDVSEAGNYRTEAWLNVAGEDRIWILSNPIYVQQTLSNSGLTATSRGGMVVSVSKPASEVGREILRAGGNAVDAAIAVGFALAVSWPEAGNIGGGGFMVVHPANGEPPICVDYREKAPAAATVDMFAKGQGSQYRLVGVPGTVRGLNLAHQRYGRLPWNQLVIPAVKLAREGFAVNKELAASLNRAIQANPENVEFQRVFRHDGGKTPWKAGDQLVQPDLAATLQSIADSGADVFYSGNIADSIEREMTLGDGLIKKRDLADYQAVIRTPIHGTFRGYDIYSPPPPSSGGIVLVQMLNLAEQFDLRKEGRWSAKTLHLMVECMRRAYLDRARFLGDPDFTAIPDKLTSKEYAKELARTINPTLATSSKELGADILTPQESAHTTHFSIVDREGMAVSNTYTLEDAFGSQIVVRGSGFLLNNEMGDFNPRPGLTDATGLIGTKANQVAPGKRMLSSMTPTIISKNGKVQLVTGSPGGRTIINTLFCNLMSVLEFDIPIRDAIDGPRFHHAWMPDVVWSEADLLLNHEKVLSELKAMGHKIGKNPDLQGDAHSIFVSPESNERTGAADRRLNGWAAGE